MEGRISVYVISKSNLNHYVLDYIDWIVLNMNNLAIEVVDTYYSDMKPDFVWSLFWFGYIVWVYFG